MKTSMRQALRDIVLNGVAAWPVIPGHHRWRVLRLLGVDVAASSIMSGAVFTGRDVSIGAGCYVNRECLFDASAPVRLGENVYVGMRAMFVTSGHGLGGSGQRAGTLQARPITVGDGAWIGAGATLLPGVTVGRGCVVAAGAVVTRDCDDDGVYAGVPARRIRDLPRDADDRAARATPTSP